MDNYSGEKGAYAWFKGQIAQYSRFLCHTRVCVCVCCKSMHSSAHSVQPVPSRPERETTGHVY